MHHHCHCPPAHHCPPPCPSPPPPFAQQDLWNPVFGPVFYPALFPRPGSSSSLWDSDDGASRTVRVEVPPATTGDDAAPLLDPKLDGANAGPFGLVLLFGLVFWATVAGIVYWHCFR